MAYKELREILDEAEMLAQRAVDSFNNKNLPSAIQDGGDALMLIRYAYRHIDLGDDVKEVADLIAESGRAATVERLISPLLQILSLMRKRLDMSYERK